MKKSSFLAITALAISLSSAPAQEPIFNQLRALPHGVEDLSGLDKNADAAREVFAKDAASIGNEDIAEQIANGGKLFLMQNSAILMVEGSEPVLLAPRAGGGIDAMYICRIIPVCVEKPER